VIFHRRGIFVGVAEYRTVKSDYRYSGINLAAKLLGQSIDVTSAFLAGKIGEAGFGGYSGFVFQLDTQAIQLVIPDGTCQIRTQDHHTYNNQQHKPDSYTPLNTSEQFQPSNL
jgi:hypothetical protein